MFSLLAIPVLIAAAVQDSDPRPALPSGVLGASHRDVELNRLTLQPILAEAPGPAVEASASSIRQRAVSANVDALEANSAGVRLNMFADAQFDLTPQTIESRGPECFTWVGGLDGAGTGWFVLVRENDALIANVWTNDGHSFELRPDGAGRSVARQVNPATINDCDCGNAPVSNLAVAPANPPAPDQADSCAEFIDVLIVHTAAARIAAGGLNSLHAIAHGSIAAANVAFANSAIGTRLRLSQVEEVVYTESNVFSTDLTRLSIAGDGFLDKVQTLRNDTAADVVCLIVGSQASCGIAFVMTSPSPGFEALAYSVVNVNCAITSLGLPHEIGHNLGCQHINGDGTNGAFPYSYGRQFIGASGQQWRSVMATGAGFRVPQFSNPDVLFDGVPTGIAQGLSGAADNARTINNTAAIASAFRTAPLQDCNRNGVSDACDISSGFSEDANANGIPDECDGPSCPQPASAFLTADAPNSFDIFGASVSLAADGFTVVAGADFDDGAGVSAGDAHVFGRAGDQWTHQARLVGDNTVLFDHFGRAVAVSANGQTIVAGALFHDVSNPDTGAAYVFVRNNGTWSQQAILTANDGDFSDLFGFAVAISATGDRAAISALGDDDGGSQSGSVYIFDRSGTTWMQTAKMVAGDATAGSEFGIALALTPDGTRVLIGARSADALTTNFGAAYVFRLEGPNWQQEAKLVAEDVQSGDRLGGSVSLDAAGSIALVGARGEDDAGEDSGAAYVFERTGTIWRQRAKLKAPDASAFKSFGASVALSPAGDRLLIGSYLDRPRGPSDVPSGSAYEFVREGSSWRAVRKIAPAAGDIAANDNFGVSLSIAQCADRGLLAAIAAPLDDHADTVDGGSVRIIALDELSPDCNVNSLADSCDIAQGLSLDVDNDGVPDECPPIEPCPADVAPSSAGDGVVNIADLLYAISHWGPCNPPPSTCAADLDGSGDVDIHDLLAVIAAWGTCR